MKSLQELFDKHRVDGWPDKDSIHSYGVVYEEILAPYRHTAKNILEIGLMSGQSLRMWTEYFSGKVYGMDCSLTPIDGLADLRPIIAEGKYNVIIGDATNSACIEQHFKDIKFDIVYDDGNHVTACQVQTFNLLKDKMAKGGLYIIEDPENLDQDRKVYLSLHNNVEILDRRHIKGRFDDALILVRF